MAERQFRLPDLGEGLEEAEIVTWRVAEGDDVELNQPLAEVETAKALVEIPSPFAGKVTRLHAAEGEVVQVGTALVTFEVAGEEAVEAPDEAPSEAAPTRQAVLVGYGVAPVEEPSGPGGARAPRRGSERVRVAASPPVRKLARELGVDLATLAGSGPGGRVTREDVERAAQAPATRGVPSGEGDERIPVRGVRRAVAQHMARAAAEIPHVTTFLTVDFSWVLELRDELQGSTTTKVTPLAVVGLALAEVAREHRRLNASFDAEASEIVLRRDVNLGIATDTERGLLVPVVHGAGGMGITELATRIAEVVEAARTAKATPDQLVGGTVTITNVGTFGAEFGTPIINHPEAAILALGVIEPRPLVQEGELVIKPAATLSLSFDHRVLDGAEAGRALAALRDVLEGPLRLGALPR